jgi:hypothetical protein
MAINLGSMYFDISVNTKALKRAEADLKRFSNTAHKHDRKSSKAFRNTANSFGKNTKAVKKFGKQGKKSLTEVQLASKYLNNSLARTRTSIGLMSYLFVATGASILASSWFKAHKEFETLQASLVTVTGSVEKAESAFARIEKFATNTPYQLGQVTDSFIKLKAFGLDPSAAALEAYGNTASSMGKSLNQMIEAVADAATGEFERLKEFGIKSKSEGDKVSFTFKGITTTVGKNAAEIEQYLQNIGNVDFAGGMLRQMDTIAGKLSNMTDAWDGFMRSVGETSWVKNRISDITYALGVYTDDSQIQKMHDASIRLGKINLYIGHIQEQLNKGKDGNVFMRALTNDDSLKKLKSKLADYKKERDELLAGDTFGSDMNAKNATPEKLNPVQNYAFEAAAEQKHYDNIADIRKKDLARLSFHHDTETNIMREGIQSRAAEHLSLAKQAQLERGQAFVQIMSDQFGQQGAITAQAYTEQHAKLREALVNNEISEQEFNQRRLENEAAWAEAKSQLMSTAAERDFEAFMERGLSKEEQQNAQWARELEALKLTLGEKLGAEELYAKAVADISKRKEDREKKKVKREKKLKEEELSFQKSSFEKSFATASTQSKNLFKAKKLYDIAQATIAGAKAVQDAYAFGSSFLGPVGGAAAAGIAAVATAANIQAIRSTNFSGKAVGGNVFAGQTYEVAEQGAEMLSVGGKNLLLMGNQNGYITNNDKLSKNAEKVNNYNNSSINNYSTSAQMPAPIINTQSNFNFKIITLPGQTAEITKTQTTAGTDFEVVISRIENSITNGIVRGGSDISDALENTYSLGRRGAN